MSKRTNKFRKKNLKKLNKKLLKKIKKFSIKVNSNNNNCLNSDGMIENHDYNNENKCSVDNFLGVIEEGEENQSFEFNDFSGVWKEDEKCPARKSDSVAENKISFNEDSTEFSEKKT
jgi:hypothetical protein